MFSKVAIVTLFLQTLVSSLQLENNSSVYLTTIAKTSAVSDYSTSCVTVYQLDSLESDPTFVKHDKRLLVSPNNDTTSTTTSISTPTTLSSTYTDPVLEDFKNNFFVGRIAAQTIANGQVTYEIYFEDYYSSGLLIEAVASPGTFFSPEDYSLSSTFTGECNYAKQQFYLKDLILKL